MAEFFAADGSVEAAKVVLSEAIKQGPDLGKFLRGGSFASCAQVYRNLSSPFDRDSAFFACNKNTRRPSVGRPSYNRSFSPIGVQQYSNRNQSYPNRDRLYSNRFPFPSGFCYQFQRTSACYIPRCPFKHKCSTCEDMNHGATSCPRSAQNWERSTAEPENQNDTRG